MGLKRVTKVCRVLFLSSLAIAYLAAYFSLSSNSEFSIPEGDVSYVDRQNRNETITTTPTLTESLYDSRQSKIRRTAAKISRVYEPSHPSTWCVDERLKLDQKPQQPMGLCYLRIPHSAGATLKGINMRIARNFGQRYGLKSCIRHDSNERGMQYGHRDKLSYLWTFVRDPTHRAMSAIGKKLSNQLLKSNSRDSFTGDGMAEFNKTILVDKTLDLLQHATDVRDAVLSEGRGGFQFQFVLQQYIPANDVNDPLHPGEIADPDVLALKVSRTFRKYDFVGIVERFEESLVAMQLLLGLETSDILYFAVNRKEQWRRARVGRNKFVCRHSFDWEDDLITEPPIQDYITESKEWYAQNYGDYLLYHASNQSLDQTIAKIGSDFFSLELKKFRSLLKRANEECSPIFPCSLNGTDQFEEAQYDCLSDGMIGCGYRCLDGLTA